jgi:hypothetical protein
MLKKIVCFGIMLSLFFSLGACSNAERGRFYTLQEAYDLGFLSTGNLERIAANSRFSEARRGLNKRTEEAIVESWVRHLNSQGRETEAKVEDYFVQTYGVFGSSFAIRMWDYFIHTTDYQGVRYNIDGVEFRWDRRWPIMIWRG